MYSEMRDELINESKRKNNTPENKTLEYFDENHQGEILDKIGVRKMCCRRHMLTHVDLVDMI